MHLLTLQIRGRELRIHAPSIQPLEVDAHIDLAGTDTVDADAGTLEDGDAGTDHAQRRVGGHGEAGAPAAAVGAGGAADHDDAAVLAVLGRGVGVVALGRGLGHGVWGVLEGEEGGHGVGFEAFLEVFRGGGVDGGGAEEARGADPDVEAAPGVEGFVDEG